MLKNFLKIAFRNIFRNKAYSLINIISLMIGITSCIFILMYVNHEMSYDRYHVDHERIFRVAEDIQKKKGNRIFACIGAPVATALKKDFPQVQYAGRIVELGTGLVKYEKEEKIFFEGNRYAADQDILNVFSISFLKGNPQKALGRPKTLVITERIAVKYFGNKNPLGEVFKINNRDYEVTGVVTNPPSNTHWKYDLIVSMKTFEKQNFLTNWHATMAYTYIKLHPNVDSKIFGEQVHRIADRYIADTLKEWGLAYRFFLQPIADIHLYSNLNYELAPPGNPQMITIFSTVGLLVLLIACMNFINLATARSVNRAREVGMRKVIGGQKKQLILQFLGESFLAAFLSFIPALCFLWLFTPLFNQLLGTDFAFSSLFQPTMIVIMAALLLFISLGAGLYPAFFLSNFKPVSVLKPSLSSVSTKSILRKILVLFQFTISIILLIMTISVHKQLRFMKNQHLGFDKEQKLVIPFRGGISIEKNYNSIKDEYVKHPNILNAAVSSGVPGRGLSNFGVYLLGEGEIVNLSMYHTYFDPDFITNYNIKVIVGRTFNKELRTDQGKTCLLNRVAVEALGISSPEKAVGRVIESGYGGKHLRVIGVTENVHYRGLQYEVEPMVMGWLPEMFDNMTLTVNTKNLDETLAFAKKTWERFFPGYPFEYYFLDENFNKQYLTEERTGNLFGIFTILGQLIACLGLLGLAAFTTQQRTKEIGVRKVLGASPSGIVFLISKEFLKWILLANIIAWPTAYFALNNWLNNFAHRTLIGVWPFIFSALLAFIIAIITVSYQSFRAASINPAEALRYE